MDKIVKPTFDLSEMIGPPEGLFVGSYYTAKDIVEGGANPSQITAILNLHRPDWMGEYCAEMGAGFKYKEVFFHDGQPISEDDITACLKFIAAAQNEERNVLVHCAAGMSRSPGIAVAYFIDSGMAFDDALDWVLARRPQAQIHPEIMTSIKKYFKIWPYTKENQC